MTVEVDIDAEQVTLTFGDVAYTFLVSMTEKGAVVFTLPDNINRVQVGIYDPRKDAVLNVEPRRPYIPGPFTSPMNPHYVKMLAAAGRDWVAQKAAEPRG